MKHVYRIDIEDTVTNLEDIATQGDLVQYPKLGLTITGKTLEQYFMNNDKKWEALQALNISASK